MAVIFIYQFFLMPTPKVPRRQTGPAPSEQAAPRVEPPAAETATPLEQVPVSLPAKALEGELSERLAQQENAREEEYLIDAGYFQATIGGGGADLKSWLLSEYSGRDKKALEMVPRIEGGSPAPLSILFSDENLTRGFSTGGFLLEGERPKPSPSGYEGKLTFSRVDNSGLKVSKTYTFHRNSYIFELDVEVRNLGGVAAEIPWWIYWGPGLGREAANARDTDRDPLALYGGQIEKFKLKKDGERLPVPAGMSWLGIPARYFLMAVIPGSGETDAFALRQQPAGGAPVYTVGIGPKRAMLPAGGAQKFGCRIYIGPKSIHILRTYGANLEKAVDFGWFGWLGRPLLEILKFFYRFVGNWGLAIILLTFMVKLILFPITFNMYKSMKKMQEMQPQIAALKKKYKDDTQALNRETMELYRANKINPMGGCLPMIIQIPVFIALYKVLSIAIELRGAGFLHIADLSEGETTMGQFLHGLMPSFPEAVLPIKLLVVLMGVTMLLQQRLSPTAMDPRQAKMMMFLPVIFTAMFWNFSSGLVVYFLFSNTLAIGEQMLIRKLTATTEKVEHGRKNRKADE